MPASRPWKLLTLSIVSLSAIAVGIVAWGEMQVETLVRTAVVPSAPQEVEHIGVAVVAEVPRISAPLAAAPDSMAETPQAENFSEVKFMARGHCYAQSQAADRRAAGGFGKSDNEAKQVNSKSPGRGLYLFAQPGVVTDFFGKKGMRVLLVNRTANPVVFAACDSRLAIVQEAKDESGKWQPIEYLPSSWCGNSYHRVYLNSDYFWEFAVSRYQGPIKTKLRFTMKLADGSQLVSNEFDGSVHKEQFSIKEGHTATNIMDPYND